MFHIVLYQPEIPPNTGNIIRLCANTGAKLHLIEPLGFRLEDKKLRRAGLDYHEWASLNIYENLDICLEKIRVNSLQSVYACSTHGNNFYHSVVYHPDDILLFGPETRGLPEDIRKKHTTLRIPMSPESRSLNLSNAAAIILYEAWRQQKFTGAV